MTNRILVWSAAAGVAVLLSAPCQERSPVTLRDHDAVVGATVVDASGPRATVSDLVVQPETGRITALVLCLAGPPARCVGLPYGVVRWDEGAARFELRDGAPDLAALPDLESHSLQPWRRATSSEGRPDEAAAEPRWVATGELLGSVLRHARLRVAGCGADVVRGAVLELRTGHVAFVMASHVHGPAAVGELHPVPWTACRPVPEPVRGQREPGFALAVRAMREPLERAPNAADAPLADPLYRGLVYRFFRVEPPPYETPQ